MALLLVVPSEANFAKYADSIKSAVSEFDKDTSPYLTNCARRMKVAVENFPEYMEKFEQDQHPQNPEFVPSTDLWLVKDGKFVGVFSMRHALNDFLRHRGGNVAYSIVPSQRGNGFAKAGLKLAVKYAHNNLNLDRILVTCNSKNIPSHKTMLSVMRDFGGYEDTSVPIEDFIENRVWIYTSPGVER